MQIFFDDWEPAKGDVTKHVDQLFAWCAPSKQSSSSKKHQPSALTFFWGDNNQLADRKFYLEKVNVKYTLFGRTGNPRRATADISLKEISDPDGPQNPTSGAINARRTHLISDGDTLQSIANEEYGQYVRGSFLGKFDEVSWGPSPLFTEVDGYLYDFFRGGQPGNRSHVADTRLDVLLEAQRRYTSKPSRRKVIDDIQRHAAAQVYYVYTPCPRNVSAWTSRVKNYGPKNSFDRGAQLEVVWLADI